MVKERYSLESKSLCYEIQFDELQSHFDNNAHYSNKHKKQNLIIGFTATPDDHTLARFGEFSGYAESEKLWRPFDSYTMKEAIEDGYILNPLKNIVPIASKMLFDVPSNSLSGFTEMEYKDAQKNKFMKIVIVLMQLANM